MADNEPAEGADGADAIPAKKGKLKLLSQPPATAAELEALAASEAAGG